VTLYTVALNVTGSSGIIEADVLSRTYMFFYAPFPGRVYLIRTISRRPQTCFLLPKDSKRAATIPGVGQEPATSIENAM